MKPEPNADNRDAWVHISVTLGPILKEMLQRSSQLAVENPEKSCLAGRASHSESKGFVQAAARRNW
jgi:hypothetical protein